jgi:hypothetical protein
MSLLIPCGLDLGNRRTKIHLLGKSASIPSVIGFDPPVVLGKKPVAFSLLFNIDDTDYELWFGRDTLACEEPRQGLHQVKYNISYIQQLFQGALYYWSKKHSYDIARLGKLNIVTSMPPGLFYNDQKMANKAKNAYKKAFSTGQSHMKIRPAKGEAIQIVTQFAGLQPEAALFGRSTLRKGKLILVIDLGGGTTDVVLFNGTAEPAFVKTYYNGLVRAYKTNPIDPQKIELKVLTNKKYWPSSLVAYYDAILNFIVQLIVEMQKGPDVIYIIGGGADLMPPSIQSQFKQLAKDVYIKGQYVNAIANWKEASE